VLRLAAFAGLVGAFGCDRLFQLDHIDCPRCDGGARDASGDAGAETDAPDLDPTGDADGDGISNGTDNCPATANNNQRDHDGDSVGDACDPCPHLPLAVDNFDTDGDRLGDGCDPRPDMPGDAFTLFVGFYDASDIDGWVPSPPTGEWLVTSGVLRLTANNIVGTIELPDMRDDLFVQLRVQGKTLGPGTIHSFAISAGRTPQMRHDCEISGGGTSQLRYNEPGATPSVSWSGSLTQSNPMTLLLDGTHVICAVGGLSSATLDYSPAGPSTGMHMGILGLVATVVAVDIDYLFIATPG